MPKPAQSPDTCRHCGQPLAAGDSDFCCGGCEAAWYLLRELELPAALQAREASGPDSANSDASGDLDSYALPAVAERYLVSSGSGELRLDLVVSGMHCVSCALVCERGLSALPTVRSVTVDARSGRARLVFAEGAVADLATGGAGPIVRAVRRLRLLGYDGRPIAPGGGSAELLSEGRGRLWKLALAGFAAGNTMMLGIALWSGLFDGSLAPAYKRLFEWWQFVLTTPVFLYAAREFHRGWRGFWQTGTLGMDALISAGISAAYFYSVFVFVRGLGWLDAWLPPFLSHADGPVHHEVYFDSVTMIVFFLLVGRYIEWRSRLRQRERLEQLLRPLPDDCRRLREGAGSDTTSTERIAVRELRVGDRIVVAPGECVPADCVLVAERAASGGDILAARFDEAVLSGESHPRRREPGDRVPAGARLIAVDTVPAGRSSAGPEGAGEVVVLEAISTARQSSLGVLAEQSATAGYRKSPIELLGAKSVPYFGAAVLLIAAGSFGYFFWFTMLGFETALLTAISVLIVACPCALALAAPTATGAASYLALERAGVLFRDGGVIEALPRVRQFFFDKTGTLSEGRPQIVDRYYPAASNSAGDTAADSQLLAHRWIIALEAGTLHPIGQALLACARQNLSETRSAGAISEADAELELRVDRSAIQSVPGQGLEYSDQRRGQRVRIGRPGFAGAADAQSWRKFLAAPENASLVCVAVRELRAGAGPDRENVLAVFAVYDPPRPDAAGLLRELRDDGAEIAMLTGDQPGPAAELADQLGFASHEAVRAGLTPSEKARLLQKAKRSFGAKPSRAAKQGDALIAMVGDGYNDAPALAAADVSIVHALGAPLALEQAGVVLLNNRLSDLSRARRIARAGRRLIRFNLGISLGYNALLIPLAATGHLLPIWCAIFMALSSLTVVGSAFVFRAYYRRRVDSAPLNQQAAASAAT